jgi:hypothetical protein
MNTVARTGIVAALIAGAAGLYFSPHLAVRSMRSAALAHDGAKLAGYIDFPAVKESFKGTINAKLAAETAKPVNNPGMAVIGNAFAAVVVNQMVDAMVTPDTLIHLVNGDRPQFGRAAATPVATVASGPESPPDNDVDTSMGYEGFSNFVVQVRKKGSTDSPTGLVFSRDGLFGWKLTSLRVPM